MMISTKKAISLIVLVITIIVMIILAGSIILTLSNSGIIQKASEAVDKTNEATVLEFAQTKWAEAYLKTNKSQQALEEYVITELEKAEIDTNEYFIKVTTSGVIVIKSVEAIVDGVPIPKGFVASQATGENRAAKGLVIYEGNEAVTNTNIEEARRERNQYVWVPVDKDNFETTFIRKDYIYTPSALAESLGTSKKYWEVLPTTELNKENLKYMTEETLIEVQKMYASVKKYGGFYIARYEVGIDEQRKSLGVKEELPGVKEGTKVYSVMGKIPYTYISWTWDNGMNHDTYGAIEVARRMYIEDNSSYGAVSTLTYGVQWDSVAQWFIDTGTLNSDQVVKSKDFGNYNDHIINSQEELNKGALVWDYTADTNGSYVSKDSITLKYPKANGTRWALSTGALKAAKINNIYDMAGNMFEWTMEGYSGRYRALRGGALNHNGGGRSLVDRVCTPSEEPWNYSFRLSLYIK